MKKMSVAIFAVIVVIVAVVIVVLVGNNRSASNNSSNSSGSNNNSSSNSNKTAAATITYSDSGFSPDTTTVKSGDTVAVKNTSNSDLSFDSGPHPVHTDDTDLNLGEVAPGETKTFVVTKTGTFEFHNHLDASKQGTIVIQ